MKERIKDWWKNGGYKTKEDIKSWWKNGGYTTKEQIENWWKNTGHTLDLYSSLPSRANKLKTSPCCSLEDESPMSIEEAIKHAEEKASELGNTPCGKQHLQLAIWLRELQELRKEK